MNSNFYLFSTLLYLSRKTAQEEKCDFCFDKLFCILSKCFETNRHQEYFCLNQVGCPKRYCCGYRKLLLIISKTACSSVQNQNRSVVKWKIDEKPNKSASQNMNRENDSFLVKIMKIIKKMMPFFPEDTWPTSQIGQLELFQCKNHTYVKQRRKLRNLCISDGWKSKGKLKY